MSEVKRKTYDFHHAADKVTNAKQYAVDSKNANFDRAVTKLREHERRVDSVTSDNVGTVNNCRHKHCNDF